MLLGGKSKLVWNWISVGQMWPLPGLSGFLAASLSPHPLQHPVQEAQRREEGGEVGGGSVFWIGGVCSETVYNPPRCRLCREGNHFSCWETVPHVNLTPPPPVCTFTLSFLFLFSHSQCHFLLLLSVFTPLFFSNVGKIPLYSRGRVQENPTPLQLLSSKRFLLAQLCGITERICLRFE